MKQITISELKRLKAEEIKTALPFEIVSDGEVIADVKMPGESVKQEDNSQIPTKCPNCKMVYNVTKPDNQPIFMSMQKVP
jgi:hypothetical protein